MPDGSSSAHLFRPKLIAIFREHYDARDFRQDLTAALTVAIVALPLSMAFAIASGIAPAHGLYAAIVGGFLVSALGGSRYQIGGPAGAFIVLVSATVAAHGIGGMLLTVLLSGLLLALLGALRMGSLIRYIPHSVTVGFTAGIAIIILASQLKELGGLTLTGPEPGPLLPKLVALGAALHTFNPVALATGLAVVAVILAARRLRPGWPALLLGVVAAAIGAALMQLPVETIGSRFGDLPHSLPRPALPPMNMDLFIAVLPSVLGFTLLGGVESLLSAKVADGMTGRKHRSNMELVAQGIANIASALFGGMPVTGTIARTATNVRAGARSPLSGMMHALFLLLFMLVAAPLAAYVPLAALAGMLLVVCWNMAEKSEFARLLRAPGTAAILMTTFGITLLRDLTEGIIAGCIVAALLALPRNQGARE